MFLWQMYDRVNVPAAHLGAGHSACCLWPPLTAAAPPCGPARCRKSWHSAGERMSLCGKNHEVKSSQDSHWSHPKFPNTENSHLPKILSGIPTEIVQPRGTKKVTDYSGVNWGRQWEVMVRVHFLMAVVAWLRTKGRRGEQLLTLYNLMCQGCYTPSASPM